MVVHILAHREDLEAVVVAGMELMLVVAGEVAAGTVAVEVALDRAAAAAPAAVEAAVGVTLPDRGRV